MYAFMHVCVHISYTYIYIYVQRLCPQTPLLGGQGQVEGIDGWKLLSRLPMILSTTVDDIHPALNP